MYDDATPQDRKNFETFCMFGLDVAPLKKLDGVTYENEYIQMAWVGWMGKTQSNKGDTPSKPTPPPSRYYKENGKECK